jgi:hypothetical protein
MKGIGRMARGMGKESTLLRMVTSMRGIGRMARGMGKECALLRMVTSIKGIGRMTRGMDKECTRLRMVTSMKGAGRMAWCMGMATYGNGDKYEGDWKDDKRHGQGVFTCVNGK